MADSFDLIVIGAGMGGVATANHAAARGAHVALLEAAAQIFTREVSKLSCCAA